MKVLFLNHRERSCGVYQYGKRLYDVLTAKQSLPVTFAYKEVECFEAYQSAIRHQDFQVILYNYHVSTMPWLNKASMAPGFVHVGIPHECVGPFSSENTIHIPSLPRPLFEKQYVDAFVSDADPEIRDFIDYNEGPDVPVFGSFGFGFQNKGFHRIVEKVNAEFDRAIIKLVIPVAFFDPNRESTIAIARRNCEKANAKSPNVKLLITHKFLSEADLLLFLFKSTMNIFLYDKMMGRGISSTLDYAMSVGRPIGISDSFMFRHIYRDEICLYKRSIRECMETNWVQTIRPQENNDRLRSIIVSQVQEAFSRSLI